MATAAPPASRNIDIARALTFIKDDPDWIKKLLIGSLMMIAAMFFIGTPFLIGYFQRTIRRTVDGEACPLPDWDDWGGIFVDGLKVFAVILAHVAVLVIPMMCCMGGVIGLMGGAQQAGEDVGAAVGALGALAMVVVYLLIFAVAIALSLYLPAIQVRLALTGNLGDAFQTRANLAFIRRNLMNYALSLGVMLISNTIAQFGIILFCVGILPATVWAYTEFSYALGETVRRDPLFQSTGTV